MDKAATYGIDKLPLTVYNGMRSAAQSHGHKSVSFGAECADQKKSSRILELFFIDINRVRWWRIALKRKKTPSERF